MGICASCLGLRRGPAAVDANESQALLEPDPQAYGTNNTAALNARAGLEHLQYPGALGSPPRRRLRNPTFERKEREAQDLICAETNSRFIDVSWQPAPGDAGDAEMISPQSYQRHTLQPEGITETAGGAGPAIYTLFTPDYALKFRETFGQVPSFANMQYGLAMDPRQDWMAHIIHNNGGHGQNWDPNTVVLSDELKARLVMRPDDFLGERTASASGDVIRPAV